MIQTATEVSTRKVFFYQRTDNSTIPSHYSTSVDTGSDSDLHSSNSGSNDSYHYSFDELSDVENDRNSLVSEWEFELHDDLNDRSWEESFKKKLCLWALEKNVTSESVNQLLVVLRTLPIFSFLPKSSKTLLGTSRVVTTVEVPPGRYFSFDLIQAITASLKSTNVQFSTPEVILDLFLGIDGMPSSKSTPREFWPILVRLDMMDMIEKFVTIALMNFDFNV